MGWWTWVKLRLWRLELRHDETILLKVHLLALSTAFNHITQSYLSRWILNDMDLYHSNWASVSVKAWKLWKELVRENCFCFFVFFLVLFSYYFNIDSGHRWPFLKPNQLNMCVPPLSFPPQIGTFLMLANVSTLNWDDEACCYASISI